LRERLKARLKERLKEKLKEKRKGPDHVLGGGCDQGPRFGSFGGKITEGYYRNSFYMFHNL
jgi:hypothetical protein